MPSQQQCVDIPRSFLIRVDLPEATRQQPQQRKVLKIYPFAALCK